MNIVQIYRKFPTEADCIHHLESVRWPNRPVCPYCKASASTPLPTESRHHCNACNTTFSVTVGTIFHHTHLPLQKWLLAVTLVLNAKKGLSARQLARDLEINKNTGWRIAMQIRQAMSEREHRELLTGIVEMDETYVGGKPRPGNKGSRGGGRGPRGRGNSSKVPVVGMVERGGRIKAQAMRFQRLTSKQLSALVRRHVDTENATLITDEYRGYLYIKSFMPHHTINHSVCYVDGDVHTNNVESFWALLKRGIIGQYHKVSRKHLPRYIDEFSYRFNHRKTLDVFDRTIARAVGVSVS